MPDVIQTVKDKYGVAPSETSIKEHIREGHAGKSPSLLGRKESIEESTFKVLCTGFDSYIQIFQINGKGEGIIRNKLTFKVNKLMNMDLPRGTMKKRSTFQMSSLEML